MNGKLLLKHFAKWRVLYVVTLLASLSFAGVNAFDNYAPTVMSDKDDYAPGEIAIITGYGWTQDEYVDVHFEETPTFHAEHQHDFHGIKVNADGTWRIEYPIEERHLGVIFDVHVIGKQSGAEAHTRFTDGNVSFTAVGLPNGIPITVQHTYTVPNKNVELKPSSGFTTPGTSDAIASANSGTVFLSYPRTITANTKKYVITRVNAVATANNGNTTDLTVTTVGTGDYDYSFVSPSQATTVTAYYKKETVITAANASGQQGGTVTLSANLKESGSNFSGKQIRFTFNGATLTGNTNNGGNASVTANIGNLAVGSHTYTVEFLEDAEFAGSSATGTVNVTSAQATTSFANLSSPSIAYGTTTTTLGGVISSTNGVPSGSVAITLNGVTQNAAINSTTGAFSTDFATGSLGVSSSPYAITYAYAGSTNFTQVSDNSKFLTVSKAPTTTVVSVADVTFNGSAQGGSARVTGAGGLDQALTVSYEGVAPTVYSSSTAPTNAGTYTAIATYAESANHLGSTDSKTFTINKAPATLALGNLTHTYDGTEKSATATVTPAVEGVVVDGKGTNAGDYAASASLNNPNYEATPVSGTLQIARATTTTVVTVAEGSFTYTGSAITPASVTVTGPGLNLTQVANYVANVNAGEATASYSYAGGANYLPSSDSKTFIIGKANATIVVEGKTVTYDGQAHGASGTATGVKNEDLSSLLNLGASFTDVPGGTAFWTFAGNNNYNNANGSVEIKINKADQVITWTAPEKIVYGTALGETQLNASVTTGNGALTYTPGAGVFLNAGTNQTLSVTADATNNYNAVTKTVTITVDKANAVIAVSGKTITYDGNAHGATGTATGARGENLSNLLSFGESFTNVPGGTASWTFAGDANHNAANGTAAIVINKANAIVDVKGTTVTYDGNAHGATGTATGVKGETLAGLSLGESFTNAPGGTANWTFTNANYADQNGSVNIVINKAPTTTVVTITGAPFTYTGSAITPATVSVTGAGGLNLTLTAEYTNNVNAGTAIASYTYAESVNHLGSSDSKEFTINKAIATLALDNLTHVYDGTVKSAAASTLPAGLTGVSISNNGKTNAGTYEVEATLENNNFIAVPVKGNLFIDKAATSTVVTITGAPFTYTGSAITPATVSVTGPGLNLTPAATYSNNVNAGTATASYSYAGHDNYYGSSDSKTFAIGKANATIVVTGKTVTYDGTAHGASGTATGVNGETLAGLDLGANFTNAPGGTASWSFTDATGNYNNDKGEVAIAIGKRPLTLTANSREKYCGEGITFNGTEFSLTSGSLVANDAINLASISSNGAAASSPSVADGYYVDISNAVGTGLSNYSIDYVPGKLTFIGVNIDASASSSPVALGQLANLSAVVSPNVKDVEVTFIVTDEGKGEVFRKTVTTNTAGIATTSVSGLTLGVYRVVAIAGSGCSSSEAYIPVFDASGSFVTGGGWIESPAGAMPSNPDATGKANFGFVSKYKKGSSQVDGNTEFQFTAGNVNFKSTMHESGSLVIAGGKATYRGTGTVNGQTGFKFTIVAIDGDTKGTPNADRFRIKIVDSQNKVVYDNQIDKAENGDDATILGNNGTGGGSIVIHEVKEIAAANPGGKKLEAAEQLEGLSSARFDNYPNAFADQTTIRFAFDTEQSFVLEVYDIRGALVKKVATGKAEAGKVYEYDLDARNLAEGVYFAKLATGSKVQTIKMLLKK